MASTRVNFETTRQFSKFFLDYINANPSMEEFYGLFPNLANFEAQIAQKKASYEVEKRQILVDSLKNQYKNIEIKPNFDVLLAENTFTVTTGHQLNLLSGTLYFHYKIMTVISLAEKLKIAYPHCNFVPMYWMASEDHDFEEIASVHIFGKKYTWESNQKGGVGRFNTTELESLLNTIPDLPENLKDFYLKSDNLAEATRKFVDYFYGEKGLIVIDGDDKSLKSLFIENIKLDIFEHHNHDLVLKTDEKIESLGFKKQISSRPINFFYLDDSLRSRIIQNKSHFEVLDTNLTFSAKEMLNLIESSPEKFSPNVVLRPLYQETILPNLSYTGGPGETIYWLQLKAIFEAADTPFPILLPRQFALVISNQILTRWQKIGFSLEDFFENVIALRKKHLDNEEIETLNFDDELARFAQIWDEIAIKAAEADASLKDFANAEKVKALKQFDVVEKRIRKALENKHESTLKQLISIKEKLFPDGNLQERHDNFLNFYINRKDFLTEIYKDFSPFDFQMLLFFI